MDLYSSPLVLLVLAFMFWNYVSRYKFRIVISSWYLILLLICIIVVPSSFFLGSHIQTENCHRPQLAICLLGQFSPGNTACQWGASHILYSSLGGILFGHLKRQLCCEGTRLTWVCYLLDLDLEALLHNSTNLL